MEGIKFNIILKLIDVLERGLEQTQNSRNSGFICHYFAENFANLGFPESLVSGAKLYVLSSRPRHVQSQFKEVGIVLFPLALRHICMSTISRKHLSKIFESMTSAATKQKSAPLMICIRRIKPRVDLGIMRLLAKCSCDSITF